MKFSIMINAADQWRHSLHQALSLVQLMAEQGHQIHSIFFYGQAINILHDKPLLEAWQTWQAQSKAPLLLCRTLLELNHQDTALADATVGFSAVGLASWVAAVEQSDKTLELT